MRRQRHRGGDDRDTGRGGEGGDERDTGWGGGGKGVGMTETRRGRGVGDDRDTEGGGGGGGQRHGGRDDRDTHLS